MKNKLLLLTLALLAPGLARASLYLEPRIARLHISDTPDIGDVGAEVRSDRSDVIPSIALGWELLPRLRAEIRFAEIDGIEVEKRAPTTALFPGDQVSALVITRYLYQQESRIGSFALPIDALHIQKFSLTLTPIITLERSKVRLDRIYEAYHSVIANPPPLHQRTETETHASAEIVASYRLNDRAIASLGYTYAPLTAFDAHLFSAGLRFRF